MLPLRRAKSQAHFRKCRSGLDVRGEGDGTRTRNHQIDSPILGPSATPDGARGCGDDGRRKSWCSSGLDGLSCPTLSPGVIHLQPVTNPFSDGIPGQERKHPGEPVIATIHPMILRSLLIRQAVKDIEIAAKSKA